MRTQTNSGKHAETCTKRSVRMPGHRHLYAKADVKWANALALVRRHTTPRPTGNAATPRPTGNAATPGKPPYRKCCPTADSPILFNAREACAQTYFMSNIHTYAGQTKHFPYICMCKCMRINTCMCMCIYMCMCMCTYMAMCVFRCQNLTRPWQCYTWRGKLASKEMVSICVV